MTTTTYSESPSRIQVVISGCVRSTEWRGKWQNVNGHHVCISDDNSRDLLVASIYEPGGTTEGECDWYVDLTEVPEVAN